MSISAALLTALHAAIEKKVTGAAVEHLVDAPMCQGSCRLMVA